MSSKAIETLEKWLHSTQQRMNGLTTQSRVASAPDETACLNINLFNELQQSIQQHQQSATHTSAEPSMRKSKEKKKDKSSEKHLKKRTATAAKDSKKAKKPKKPTASTGKSKVTASKPDSSDEECSDSDEESSLSLSIDSSSGGSKSGVPNEKVKAISKAKTTDKMKPKGKKKQASPQKKGNQLQVVAAKTTTVTLVAKLCEHDRLIWEDRFKNGQADIYSDAPVLKSTCKPLTGTEEDVGRSVILYACVCLKPYKDLTSNASNDH